MDNVHKEVVKSEVRKQELEKQKKTMWIKIAGGVVLLATGIILYKKRQKKLGTTLMTSSVSMIAGALPTHAS